MNTGIGAEQRAMLVEAVTRIFEAEVDHARLQQAKRTGIDRALWGVLEDSGVPRLLLPEDAGGIGGSLADLAPVLHQAGRAAAPVPIAETAALAAWMLHASGAPVPQGPLGVAPVNGESVLAARGDGGWRISGRLRRVPWARDVDAIVLLAQSMDGRVIALLDPRGLDLRAGHNLAREPRDDIELVDQPVPAERVFAAGRGVTARALRLRGALVRSLMIAGALERALELSIDYARVRSQFGRKIGSFQAIQHELARLAGEVAAARAAAGSAVNALEREDALLAVAAAKIRTAEAAGAAAMIAHQVHGAIGATDEYGLHHLTLRAWAWREEFGNEAAWSAELGRAVVRAGADRFWPAITSAYRK